jgi:hypothetical protein
MSYIPQKTRFTVTGISTFSGIMRKTDIYACSADHAVALIIDEVLSARSLPKLIIKGIPIPAHIVIGVEPRI